MPIVVCLDFDGVLDRDAEGAVDFILECLGSGYRVVINSVRCERPQAEEAIHSWLGRHLPDEARQIRVVHKKPLADLYIDNKGFRFSGEFPTMEDIYNYSVSGTRLAYGDFELEGS